MIIFGRTLNDMDNDVGYNDEDDDEDENGENDETDKNNYVESVYRSNCCCYSFPLFLI